MSQKKFKKIGLALSGGGVRATVFHLGVIARLAKGNQMEFVAEISTVSGGSLAVALIYCHSDKKWPSSEYYLNYVVPKIKKRLTTATLQWSYTWRVFTRPWSFVTGRANILAKQMEKQWGIEGTLGQVDSPPIWTINATCYETGKNWRFREGKMGDYVATNKFDASLLNLSSAVAASAAVPGLIGPLLLKANKNKKYRLWDGGVYDNLGMEVLYAPRQIKKEIDFLLVSDAAAKLKTEKYSVFEKIKFGKSLLRLIDIATDQVRSLRARSFVAMLQSGKAEAEGVYINIGNTSEYILKKAKSKLELDNQLPQESVNEAANMATKLTKVSEQEFDQLFRHGFEVTNATLIGYLPESFESKPYKF